MRTHLFDHRFNIILFKMFVISRFECTARSSSPQYWGKHDNTKQKLNRCFALAARRLIHINLLDCRNTDEKLTLLRAHDRMLPICTRLFQHFVYFTYSLFGPNAGHTRKFHLAISIQAHLRDAVCGLAARYTLPPSASDFYKYSSCSLSCKILNQFLHEHLNKPRAALVALLSSDVHKLYKRFAQSLYTS